MMRRIRRWLLGLFRQFPQARELPNPLYVKAQLPRSIFTKRLTKGRRKELWRALRSLTPEQRAIAKAKGWDKGLLS